MSHTFGPSSVARGVAEVLRQLESAAGECLDSAGGQLIEILEEPGRRDIRGLLLPGAARNDLAAREIAGTAACLANTPPHAGALVVGVDRSGELSGTRLDSEWLRRRIYELTDGQLTVDVAEVSVREVRLLVVTCPRAVEPVRIDGVVRWRVGGHCSEVDASTWHARRLDALQYDWSAEPSSEPAHRARAAAVAQARSFLQDSGEPHALELAGASDGDLLRRLNVVTGDGTLTNAGELAFVGGGGPSLDYIRREQAGGDSVIRVRREGRSMLEELSEVFLALDLNNRTLHLGSGLSVGQLREVPLLAAREAVVNGLAHREWAVAEPTVVEHVGRTLRVTSPGGFMAGVTQSNIITHPSRSRNRSLTELLAALRVAEREGIGVDRMVREMVAVGHRPPDIREVPGPYVRTALIGDALDEAWIEWLSRLQPRNEREDLNSLLILRHLVEVGWADSDSAAPVLQLTPAEASGALEKLAASTMGGSPVLVRVEGVPAGGAPASCLSRVARDHLSALDRLAARPSRWPERDAVAVDYARARGRISTTELGSLVAASPTNVGGVLKALEEEGRLAPSRPTRRGKGFYYRWVDPVP